MTAWTSDELTKIGGQKSCSSRHGDATARCETQ